MTRAALPLQHAPLTQYLDKGASLDPGAPCLTRADGLPQHPTAAGWTLSYAAVQALSYRVARALARSGIRPGDKVATLSDNGPVAFACIFGIARAGAVWCPVDPGNAAVADAALLDLVECAALLYSPTFAARVARVLPDLPLLGTCVCLTEADFEVPGSFTFLEWLDGLDDGPYETAQLDDLAMIVGTGGTTGRPKGVMLTGHNVETMTVQSLMGHRFEGRPVYLPLTAWSHPAGALCFPILAAGGEVVVMPTPDLGAFLALVARHRVTHTFLTPTLIETLLDEPALGRADLRSLQTVWYGGGAVAADLLAEALERIGPMAQLFGRTEAPLTISMMATADHYRPDGSLATERLTSAGRPAPLVSVAIMDADGRLLPSGVRGEIVVRSPLVMAGYYQDPAATAQAFRHGWHHTGDVGYLDADHFLYLLDRVEEVEDESAALRG